MPFIDINNKKKPFKYKIFITTSKKEKSEEENINSEINSENNNNNINNNTPRKVIFRMDKKYKNMTQIKMKMKMN